MTKVLVELGGPDGWHLVGEVTDDGPLGSLSSDEPVGRQVYMFGFLPDEAPGVWRSIAGVDMEAESAREIHTICLDRVADLTMGFFELEVWNAAGPRKVRFSLDRLAPGFYVNDAGELHVDVPEVLRSQGIPVTQENIDDATELFAQAAREQLPDSSEVVVEEAMHFDGLCPFLTCLELGPHDHPICPACGAVNYGNMFCDTCQRERA
jgi:hypothetical protein